MKLCLVKQDFPAGIYLLKVNNRNTRTKCEICSKLTIKTTERYFLHIFDGPNLLIIFLFSKKKEGVLSKNNSVLPV